MYSSQGHRNKKFKEMSELDNDDIIALLKEKFPGIHGRLGDLGAIDPTYEVAISTAIEALDYIVIDEAATSIQCIKFLRERSVGYAVFIALDSLKEWEVKMKEKFSAPGESIRLFDLINVDEVKFRPAFYFALKNTLVVTDQKEAEKLISEGYTKDDIVTLDGEHISASGTLSGGGMACKGKIRTIPVDSDDFQSWFNY